MTKKTEGRGDVVKIEICWQDWKIHGQNGNVITYIDYYLPKTPAKGTVYKHLFNGSMQF